MLCRVLRPVLSASKRAALLPTVQTRGLVQCVSARQYIGSSRKSLSRSQMRWFAVHKEVVPGLGDSISEAIILKWEKDVGAYVNVDDILVTLETDKVSTEIRAHAAGVLTKQLAKSGDTVKVGAIVAEVDTDAKPPANAAKPAAAAAPSPAPAAKPAAQAAPAAAPAPAPAQAAPAPAPAAAKPSPAPSAAPPKPPVAMPPPPPDGSRNERRVRASAMRLTIARRLKESQNTAAMLTTFNEIDMTNLMALREKYKTDFEKKHGVKIGFMSCFVKASANALRKFPDVNGYLDTEKKEVVYRDFVDVSVAVATPTGLVVPVLRNVEMMSFRDIEAAISALGEKARKNQIAIEDMVGGTFTVSNGGVYGSMWGTPIINPPQSAILGMHGIFKRPMCVGDKIEGRQMMYVALTYDHRMIDGATAVQFLRAIKDQVEDPQRMLLDL